jgi:16S rRNA (cytosine1402-N4)-methyltransferase
MVYTHISVMPAEVMEVLDCRPAGIYVDATLGGTGHAQAMLHRIGARGRLIGIDQDPDAIANARQTLLPFASQVDLIHDNFAHLPQILADLGRRGVDGILVDLGISLHQLQGSGRGFSFQNDEPLDMRMNPETGIRAEQLVNQASEAQLADYLYRYGEERFSRRIARRIIEVRRRQPIVTSAQLAKIVCQAVPKSKTAKIHPATRTFQALRIAVNQELQQLETFMDSVAQLLNPGGRLCVLAFHSLEDRIVKQRLRALEKGCICPPDFPHCVCHRQPLVKLLTRKAVRPTASEIRANPMARSTRLRACERIEDKQRG